MNLAERNARMVIAIKMMEEVIGDAKAELRKEGEATVDRGEVWRRCGMPLMAHDTQVIRFIEKQRAEFVETKTRIGSWGTPDISVNPPSTDSGG